MSVRDNLRTVALVLDCGGKVQLSCEMADVEACARGGRPQRERVHDGELTGAGRRMVEFGQGGEGRTAYGEAPIRHLVID